MLDLKGLDTFVWLARLRSFRTTAAHLNTTQPAVSARIAQLEQSLGVILFHRTSRHVSLTPRGLELLSHAERMLAEREEILRNFADQETIRGTVRLGVSETIVHVWLTAFVAELHRRYPRVTLDIEVDTSSQLRDRLVAAELDVAFLLGPVDEPRIGNRALCSYPLGWVCGAPIELPDASPVPLAELTRWPIITYARKTQPYVAIEDMLLRHNIRDARIFANSSLATILRLVRGGLGIGYVPPMFLAAELSSGAMRLVRAAQPLASLDYTVSWVRYPEGRIADVIAQLASLTAASHPDPLSEAPDR
jgi:DNA-binding transcriptional LysR family regulator